MTDLLFPGALLLAGGLLLAFVPTKLRGAAAILLTVVSFAHMLTLPLGYSVQAHLYGYSLELVRSDAWSRLFGVAFHLAALLGTLYMLGARNAVEQCATLAYAGGAIAAVYAGDLLTLFFFWEVTALASVLLIWMRRTERSYRTGLRYLLVQVASGVLLLSGIVLHALDTGSLAFTRLALGEAGTVCLLLAFGIKAGFPLLHAWLPDAYPESTPGGTVVLASFSTKLALYALARTFAGTELLVPIGATMAVFPIVFALLEADLRRALVYSLIGQLGFMVVGIGVGTPLSLNGSAAHAFASTIYHGLLLMSLGAVLERARTVNAPELGPLYRRMPLTTAACLVGAAAISSLPGLSAFTTKSMVVSAVGEAHLEIVYGALLVATAGTLLHSGLRVPLAAFFGAESSAPARTDLREAPWFMLAAMGLAAALTLGIGLYPSLLYGLLPYRVDYVPYTFEHVRSMLEILLFGAVAMVLLARRGLYPLSKPGTLLDADRIYRGGGLALVLASSRLIERLRARARSATLRTRGSLLTHLRALHAPSGTLGSPWTAGTTALWAVLMLVLALGLYAR